MGIPILARPSLGYGYSNSSSAEDRILRLIGPILYPLMPWLLIIRASEGIGLIAEEFRIVKPCLDYDHI